MSASDQEKVTETPESEAESGATGEPVGNAAGAPESGTATAVRESREKRETELPEDDADPGEADDDGEDGHDSHDGKDGDGDFEDADGEDGHDEDDGDDDHEDHEDHEDDDSALTPRQARRLRVAVASILLVAMAGLLAVRLANRGTVLVVGLYGFAMILCGVVIELSRHGRTRLATWLLGAGLAATLATDWLLLP
ncbi:hypothetical protein [Streptomyces sp. NPDC058653]|uniref:hypothetical protein n=1 Tax=Streptomyces sp. NPDC058653 TaxID=3346576 RepID=UPI003653856D